MSNKRKHPEPSYLADSQAIKSNALISAKYKSNLLENKILTYAFAHVKEIKSAPDAYIYTFSAAELMNVLGASYTSGSFYSRLKEAAQSMISRTMGFENPETKEFGFYNVINSAVYTNGTFTIKFNKDLGKKVLFNLSSNFTKLPLLTMMEFKSVYAMRLYELLKSRCYRPNGSKESKTHYEIMYGLSELKLSLGVINANLDAVQKVLNGKKILTDEDYDIAVEKAPEKMFDSWNSFRIHVIDIALKEINETKDTGMTVSYDTVRKGRGGKISKIIFKIDLDNQNEKEKNISAADLTEDEKLDLIDEFVEQCYEAGFRVKLREAKAIVEAADYDTYILFRALKICEASKETIKNFVPYIIAAINEEYIPSKKQFAR